MLIAVAVWLYTPDKSRAVLEAKYLKPSDRYIDVAGVRLRVRETGPGAAPAVILLHGFGDSLETWEGWSATLGADYRVIRYDMPGFALTGPDPTGDYTDRRGLVVLGALMDRLELARASLIGNSLGGKIAWNFAVEHPERVDRLILVSPDGYASPGFEYGRKPDVPALLRLLPYTLPRFMVKANLAPAYGDPSRVTDALVTRYRDLMLAPGVRRAMLARMEQVMLSDPAPLLQRLTMPTLLVWGRKDAMIPFSNAANYMSNLPDGKLADFPDLGHVPQEEAPAVSVDAVKAFLGH